jgi:hypothetical protein
MPGRKMFAPMAVAGVVGAAAFGATPAASASTTPGVRANVHRANIALRGIASASTRGDVSLPLGELTAELRVAAKIGARLAVKAHTPSAEASAASALKLVAGTAARAELALTGDVSTVAEADQSALVQAEIKVAQDREFALSALAHLAASAHASAQAEARVIVNDVATLSADGEALLAKLVSEVEPGSGACPASAVFAQLAASEATSVQADLARLDGMVSLLGGAVSADISELASVTAQQIGELNVEVLSGVNCQGDDETALIGTTLASASAAALAAVPGGTVIDASTETDSAISGAAYEVHLTDSSGNHVMVIEDVNYTVLHTGPDDDWGTLVTAGGTASASGVLGLGL